MILLGAQILFAVLTIVAIFLQQPADDQQGYSSFFSPQPVKRGWEKITFAVTIGVIIVFLTLSFFRLII